jgi:hypothetical protein
MDKFTPPIFKPANFAVPRREVNDLVSRIRTGVGGGQAPGREVATEAGQGATERAAGAPRALVR